MYCILSIENNINRSICYKIRSLFVINIDIIGERPKLRGKQKMEFAKC